MKRQRMIVTGAVLAAALLMVVLTLTAATDGSAALLPGITAKDEYPNGCVDCHRNAGANQDHRLNVALSQIKGHPDVTKIVKKVPDDCLTCHKGTGKVPALADVLHKAHYGAEAKSIFVTVYKGACLNCHQIDLASGNITVKSAAANW
jgi:hypothetical protein